MLDHLFWGHWPSAYQVQQVRSEARDALSESRDAKSQNRMLLDRVERLTLVTHALWEIIEKHTDVDVEEFKAKIEEIDLRDGVLDGKLRQGPTECPNCGRKSTRNHKVCMYCGHDLEVGPIP